MSVVTADTVARRFVLLPDRPLRFLADEQEAGDEWHPLETHVDGCRFRWIGPSTRASRLLPVRLNRRVHLRIKVLHEIQPGLLLGSRLLVNGQAMTQTRIVPCPGGFEWQADVDPKTGDDPDLDPDGILVTFEVPRTVTPQDIGLCADSRPLALGIGWIQVDPA